MKLSNLAIFVFAGAVCSKAIEKGEQVHDLAKRSLVIDEEGNPIQYEKKWSPASKAYYFGADSALMKRSYDDEFDKRAWGSASKAFYNGANTLLGKRAYDQEYEPVGYDKRWSSASRAFYNGANNLLGKRSGGPMGYGHLEPMGKRWSSASRAFYNGANNLLGKRAFDEGYGPY